MKDRVINSLLDLDFYKLNMGSVALFGKNLGVSYSDIIAEYDFINCGGTKFPAGFVEQVIHQVDLMSDLSVTSDEIEFLAQCPFIRPAYLDFLKNYRFNPDEVEAFQDSVGNLKIHIIGPWYRTIYWETCLMSIVSELYFCMTGQEKYPDWQERIEEKAIDLSHNYVSVADFGSRRRYSFEVQDYAVKTFKDYCHTFVGTSNVYLAKKYGVKPIGTHAHELFQLHAALFGYKMANRYALQSWIDEFKGDLGIALTDTYTLDVFLKSFDKMFAKLFDGVRHDSNCPFQFTDKIIRHYKHLGIDPMTKTIVFSDGLDVNKAIELNNYCKGKIRCSFGVGTSLTNDVGVKPLNIVIKLTGVEYNQTKFKAVKLSDVPGKHTGDPREVEICKRTLGIEGVK